jgi:hypothetical protein
MKIIFSVLTFLLVFYVDTISAQEELRDEVQTFKHGLGIHAGAVTGLGFSYRYFPEKWGVQITGVPVFNQGGFFSSAGLSGMFKIKEHDKLDLFTYLGVHHIHEQYKIHQGTWPPSDQPSVIKHNFLSAGFGAGVNVHLWEVIDLSLQAGYGVFNIVNSPVSTITGEIGIYYKF